MANSWMKLYHEMLNDPKMGTMTDHLYRRTIELFLLAGQEDRDGLLPPLTQIAWALRTTVNDATLCLQELSELGIITKNPDGSYVVTNFAKRQDTNLSDAERAQKWREKQKASRELSDARHAGPVTDATQTVTQTVTNLCDAPSRSPRDENVQTVTVDKDKDKEEDKEEDKELIKLHCADAQKSEKAGPEDLSFWQRTFGPRAGMAHAFHIASGITPVKSEYGRWQNDLKDLTEAGITIPLLQAAVAQMRAENLRIKAPGSVLAIARDIAAGKGKTGHPPVQLREKRTYSAAEVLAMEQAGQL